MISMYELRKLAREAKVKYRSNLNKAQLCVALGMEPIPTNEKYERFCREKIKNSVSITLEDKNTGEKFVFKHIQSCKNN